MYIGSSKLRERKYESSNFIFFGTPKAFSLLQRIYIYIFIKEISGINNYQFSIIKLNVGSPFNNFMIDLNYYILIPFIIIAFCQIL